MEASSTPPEVLLVVEKAGAEDGAGRIKRRLENLNYQVTLKTDQELEEEKGRNLSDLLRQVVLVVISSPIESKIVKTTFRDVSIPVVVAESALFTHMGMTAGARGRDFGLAEHQTEVVIDSDQLHPIASGRFDHVKICQREGLLAWGKPRKKGSLIAALTDHPERAAIFAYEEGDQMYGVTAPARRVGIFLTQQLASIMDDSDAGWEFFDAAVEWAASHGPDQLSCVLRRERKEIQLRRDRQCYSSSVGTASSSPPVDLVGLALSGGGIRSATFSLGFLQGLQRVEPPRDSRRLQFLRGWSHENSIEIFTGVSRTGRPDGL
jgi:hypothetical protein